MNILIVGNGFDLAHGLPTKYGDFLQFINLFNEIWGKENPNEIIEAIPDNNRFKDYLTDLFTNIDKRITMDEIAELINSNHWIRYFNAQKDFIKDGWIDFESEISKVIQTLEEYKEYLIKEIRIGHGFIRCPGQAENILHLLDSNEIELADDLSPIYLRKNYLLKDLNNLIRCLEIYLSDFVENIKITTKSPDISEVAFGYVLSFNYTNTYEKVYDPGKRKGIKYDFIHGKSELSHDVENNNMVLGIDEYLPIELQSKNVDFIEFKKFYQRIYKMSNSAYIDWLNIISNSGFDKHQLFIFGHSLDVTDKDILAGFILPKNTQTTIFYYNNQVLGQQIANLVKIIGERNLIERVTGKDRTIVFKQQRSME